MSDTPTPPPPATPAPSPAAAQPATGWAPERRSLWFTLAMLGLALLGVLLVLYAWRLPPFDSTLQATDNAYVRGRVTLISPQVGGYVTEVLVQDYQQVRTGQPLVRIDDRAARQRVEQAKAALAAQQASLANSLQAQRSRSASIGGQQAALASARAQLARAEADMRRVDELVADGSVSLRERDQTRAALSQARAAVAQAEAARRIADEDLRTVEVGRGGLQAGVDSAQAALRQAEIDLSNTEVRSPADGQLGEVGVRVGQSVSAGTQLMAVVPPLMWVIANFKEAQTAHMVPGQRARFSVDALAGAELMGHVEQMSPAAGSEFSVLRPDNATGNFIKVAQRIPVRIAIDADQPLAQRLRPGMSVVVKVDTETAPKR